MKKLFFWFFVSFLWALPVSAQLVQTPNLGLYLIPFGYQNWNTPVNQNTSAIDTKLVTLNLSCTDGQVPVWASGKFSVCGTSSFDETADYTLSGHVTLNSQEICLEDGTNCPSAGSESDPAVGAVTGVVKSDGAASFSAATADVDFARADTDTKAYADNSTDGFWAHTGSGTGAARTFQNGTGISWTNPAGIAGDPTAALTSAYDCIGNSATTRVLFNSAGTCAGIASFTVNPATGVVTATGFVGPLTGNVISTGTSTFSGAIIIPSKADPGSPVTNEIWRSTTSPVGLKWYDGSTIQRTIRDTDFSGSGAGLMNRTGAGAYSIFDPTDDSILVGNGTLWQLKSIANCIDTGGQHLNYTASTNAFSCGTSGGGGLSGLTPGAYLNAFDSTTGQTTGTIVEDSDSINISKDIEVGDVSTNSWKLDTSAITGAKTQAVQNASDTFVYRATTDTLTNKTLDQAGTGNVVTIRSYVSFDVAGCNNATPSPGMDLPTSGAPTPTCFGTTTTQGTLTFADAATSTASRHFRLHPNWTGTVDVDLVWFANASSANAVRWSVALGCVADSEAVSTGPSYNTASTDDTAYTGTANQRKTTSLTTVAVTNCSAGETMYIQISRVGGHANDTLAASAELLEVGIKLRHT